MLRMFWNNEEYAKIFCEILHFPLETLKKSIYLYFLINLHKIAMSANSSGGGGLARSKRTRPLRMHVFLPLYAKRFLLKKYKILKMF